MTAAQAIAETVEPVGESLYLVPTQTIAQSTSRQVSRIRPFATVS